MINNIQGFLFDFDGVLCIDNKPINGAIELINILRNRKIPFRIVTNYTTLSRANLFNKLISIGFDVEQNHIISAAYAGVLKLRSLNSPTCEFFIQDSNACFNSDITSRFIALRASCRSMVTVAIWSLISTRMYFIQSPFIRWGLIYLLNVRLNKTTTVKISSLPRSIQKVRSHLPAPGSKA